MCRCSIPCRVLLQINGDFKFLSKSRVGVEWLTGEFFNRINKDHEREQTTGTQGEEIDREIKNSSSAHRICRAKSINKDELTTEIPIDEEEDK